MARLQPMLCGICDIIFGGENRSILEGAATFDENFFKNLIIQLLAQSPDALENETLEIKGWCRDEREFVDKAVDASQCLANAQGGLVLLGVDEDGFRRFSPCP